jgi:regulator of RNase E activity RraA
VSPGDLVVGDADGVIVVPRDIKAVVLGYARRKLPAMTGRAKRCCEGRSCATSSPNIMCCNVGHLAEPSSDRSHRCA